MLKTVGVTSCKDSGFSTQCLGEKLGLWTLTAEGQVGPVVRPRPSQTRQPFEGHASVNSSAIPFRPRNVQKRNTHCNPEARAHCRGPASSIYQPGVRLSGRTHPVLPAPQVLTSGRVGRGRPRRPRIHLLRNP